MDAINQFMESIGYAVIFILSVSLTFYLTGSLLDISDNSMKSRMEHKNLYMTSEEDLSRPMVSAVEAFSEIKESKDVDVEIGGMAMDPDILKKIREGKMTINETSLTGYYKKSVEVDGEGKVITIKYI